MTVVARSLSLAVAGCLLVSGCGHVPFSGGGEAQKACRAKFYRLSIGGMTQPDATRLVLRYQHEKEEAQRLGNEATASDCPDGPRAAALRIKSMRALLTAINDADMADDLRLDEKDLIHAEDMRDYDPVPRRLAAGFQLLRSHAEPALQDVADEIDQASRVDLEDPAAVQKAISALEAAAAASPNVAICKKAVAMIDDYELEEE
jgi:hypothetical protein